MNYDKLFKHINNNDLNKVFSFLNDLCDQFPGKDQYTYTQLKDQYVTGNSNHEYIDRLKTFVNDRKKLLLTTEELNLPNDTLDKDFQKFKNWANLGDNYRRNGKYTNAIKAYQKALEAKSSSDKGKIWYSLGTLYDYLGDTANAFDAYYRVSVITPDYYKAYDGLAWLFYSQKKFLAAIDFYQHSIKIQPKHYEAWNWLGKTYKNLGKFQKAINAYQNALGINPNYDNALHNLGWIYYHQHHYDEALINYKKALDIKPDKHQTWNDLGLVYKNIGKNKKAIKAFHQALSIKLNYANAWHNLGIVYQKESNYSESIFAYQKALKIRPQFSQSLVGIGWSYFLQGKLNKAKFYFEQLPNNHKALMNLGHISFITNKTKQAFRLYRQSLIKYTNKAKFFTDLNTDYQYLKQASPSLQNFEEVLEQLKATIKKKK